MDTTTTPKSESKKLKKLYWEIRDIPTCVLLSLFLQVFLVLFASLRHRCSNKFVIFLIWSAYLSADWIAAVAVGLITKALANPHRSHVNEGLYAFWASFLLVHLGGPDNITSFALEDNDFWLRHLFGLILQVISAGYCFYLTFPSINNNNNLLWIPTILVFVVGTVKYAERTLALYLASLDHFGDTVPDMEDESNNDDAFKLSSEPDHMELLMVSYSLFKSFKGVLIGLFVSTNLFASSKKLFLKLPPYVGFKLIEYELSFMYEVLHTKVAAVRSRIGFIFRLSSFFLILGAFILFHFVVVVDQKKDDNDHGFRGSEMLITYALLIGAIGIDTISGIKLMFSDWIIVSNGFERWKKYVPQCVLKRKRWCGSVPQYNMIDYCLDERYLWKCKFPNSVRGMVKMIKIMLFSSTEYDIDAVKSFMFENLQKGDQGIFRRPRTPDNPSRIADLFDENRFLEQILLLHLVTEFSYHQTENESSNYTEEGKKSRRICKVISDYMFYLLVTKPEMLIDSSVMEIDLQTTFHDTFEEAKTYMMKHQISDHVTACIQFINDYEYDNLVTQKDGSGTVFSNACLSAQKLNLDMEKHWTDLSYEWLEGLQLGALGCRPTLHAENTSRGGEFLTFTWFVLQHFCLTMNASNEYGEPSTNYDLNVLDG